MIEATKEKMAQLKLHAMCRAYNRLLENNSQQSMTIDEVLAHLIESEFSERASNKYTARLRQAKLRYAADFEQIDYAGGRKLDRNLMQRLGSGDWIRKSENVIITGATGVGKSFVACALAQRACALEQRVLYFSTGKLFAALEMAKADHSQARLINRLRKQNLLVLDDFGLEAISGENRIKLFEILEDRYGNNATIIVSQIPTEKWHDVIKDKTLADAICDRLLHNSHRIKLEGESLRKKKKQ